MQIHSNATTNVKQRAAIRKSDKTCRALAAHYHVSVATVHRWKGREEPQDQSCRPEKIAYAFDAHEEALLLSLRESGLALDDLIDLVEPVLGKIARCSVHRLLVRHGKNRLPKKEQQDTGTVGKFKAYGPGYLHIDLFYLPKLEETRRYCFVSVDRATRLVYLSVFEHKDAASAEAFLKECLEFYAFRVEKILTDNGREWTLAGLPSEAQPSLRHQDGEGASLREVVPEAGHRASKDEALHAQDERLGGAHQRPDQGRHDQAEPLRDGARDAAGPALLVRALQLLSRASSSLWQDALRGCPGLA